MPTSRQGSEVFSEDEDGKRKDAHLHEPILAGVKPEDEKRLRNRSMRRAQRAGLTPVQIKRLFGGQNEP